MAVTNAELLKEQTIKLFKDKPLKDDLSADKTGIGNLV